jgi:hypothetical protein
MQIVVAAFNRANPRNLAIVTILRRAADPVAPMRPDWAAWPAMPRPSPGPALPSPMPQDSAQARDLLRWLDTAAQTEPGDLAPTLWRILARWPAALALIACRMEPLWHDGTIAGQAGGIGQAARSRMAALPWRPDDAADPGIAGFVAGVADAFLAKLPAMVAVGAHVSACLEGDSDG